MRAAKLTIAAAALALAACSQSADRADAPDDAVQQENAVQENTVSLWAPDTRTVLTGEAARALAHQCSRQAPGPVGGVWTPTDAQIEALEDRLILLLAARLEAAGQTPSPGGYYRQYAGFVIGAKRVIYVNGVAESAIRREPDSAHPFDWRSQAVQICDGGPITFGVEYDPATRTFDKFAFNGSV